MATIKSRLFRLEQMTHQLKPQTAKVFIDFSDVADVEVDLPAEIVNLIDSLTKPKELKHGNT